MRKQEARKLRHGLYLLAWKSGGHSLAAVGSDEDGNRWFAATNWITVPCHDWRPVLEARIVASDGDLIGWRGKAGLIKEVRLEGGHRVGEAPG